MGLVEWFRGKKEDLERSLIGKVLSRLDTWGSAKWPAGWLKFKRAINGWKLIVGVIVFNSPDFLAWLGQNLPSLMGAFGQEATAAAPLIKTIGGVLAFIGLIHKAIKFAEPIERRGEERVVVIVQVPEQPALGEPVVKVPLTKLEADVFVAAEKRAAEDGADKERALLEALKAVKPEVLVVKDKL